MRAILINPKDKTVTEVEYTGDYRNIYEHIEADCFDVLRLGDREGHTIFVDDEGLINDKVVTHGVFRYGDRNRAVGRVLAGHGLILATDNTGESVACTLDLQQIKRDVQFGEVMRINGEYVFIEHETHDVLPIVI